MEYLSWETGVSLFNFYIYSTYFYLEPPSKYEASYGWLYLALSIHVDFDLQM